MGVFKGNHQIDFVGRYLIHAFGHAARLFDADLLQYPAYLGRYLAGSDAGAEDADFQGFICLAIDSAIRLRQALSLHKKRMFFSILVRRISISFHWV